MKNKLYIFGPHDRFNYGDLLFPIMLEYGLKKLSNKSYDVVKASIVSADLCKLGGCKSINYKELTQKVKDGDVVIVAGGESLRATWKILYSYISPWYAKLIKRPRLFKIVRKIRFEKYWLGAKSEYPYCINKSDFFKKIKVIYNSVGGGRSLEIQQIENLKQSDYMAVRDKKSFDILHSNRVENLFLVPDSAILLSDIFTVSKLLDAENKNTAKARSFLAKNEKYVFFQISKARLLHNTVVVIEQLEKLSEAEQCTILLCPIGTALGHEDHIALKKIYGSLSCPKYLIHQPHIEDIMALISQSSMYIGSSLHGAITSMSYGVPYITLDKRQSKIKAYIETWGLQVFDEVQSLDNFYLKAMDIIEQSDYQAEILQDAEIQKAKYYQSIERMLQVI
ncbi:MAG: polysaccharide pyruvyl transferase family protein [Candidatus Kapabacteria bacterium]|jgi:polysaccharide pyruvyl transferase WcaK-like protein|nr:polysaccharide pyruvyl transferase family protein [Candidatus Kapabacteria bacterium]